MPNRVIREGFLDSETTNKLSEQAQNFFIRLSLVVDDYGRFEARPELLRSKCYPVTDKRLSYVSQMLDELQHAGVIIIYVVDNKLYLQIQKFQQRTRIMRSKYPSPSDGRQMSDTRQTDVGLNPIQSESNPTPIQSNPIRPKNTEPEYTDAFKKFWEAYPNKTGKGKAFEAWRKYGDSILEPTLGALAWQVKCEQWVKDSGQFIPHPTTYLNRRGWEDEKPRLPAKHTRVIPVYQPPSQSEPPADPEAVLAIVREAQEKLAHKSKAMEISA